MTIHSYHRFYSCFLKPFLIAMTNPTRINKILAPAKNHLIVVSKARIHARAVGCDGNTESKVTMTMFSNKSKNHAPNGMMLSFRI